MKARVCSSAVSAVFLFSITLLSPGTMFAQDQNGRPATPQENWSFGMICHGLSLVSLDTVRPTLGNSGKGLLRYDCLLIKQQNKVYLYRYRGEEKPMVMKATLNDADLGILKNNLLYIDKQSQSQIKEWIWLNKMDWNLGEAINGFYMKPVY